MEVSKYIMLFHKKLKGEINSQEQEELSDWLQQENRRGFTEGLDKTWNLSKRYKQGYEPDVDAGLARLQQRIAEARKTPQPAGAQPSPARRSLYRWLAAAAAFAALATIGWWWIGNSNAASEQNALIYTTGAGESEKVLLPDGSTVILNENSFLVLSAEFNSASERPVELTGEAYFNIEPDPSRPFRITTRDAMVEVLGTAFNLRSYPEEGFTEVEVEEGSVRLSGLDNENAIQLAPGQRGICSPGAAMNAKDSPGLNAQSWRTHRLQFRNTPLSEALACLERHFKVELQLVNSQLADCGISMKFEDFTLNEVLDGLTLIFNVQVYPMEGGYRLEKGSCKPAASEMR